MIAVRFRILIRKISSLSTLSEHSDVEARIAALSEKLQTRMRTAAR